MLSQQHSQVNNTLSQFKSKNEIPSGLSPQKIPKYFEISGKHETMTVGNKFSPYRVVNVSDYDCYVLAGIEENELFSKLVMMNMNIEQGIAFDANAHKVSHHFPTNIQVINKRVSFKNDELHENLTDMGGKKDVFLKMNIYGEEYIWALSLTKENLLRFKQMVIVFHDINNNPTQQRALNKIKCFQKLKKTHDVAHISPVGDNLIVTYFRKESIDNQESIKSDQSEDGESVKRVESNDKLNNDSELINLKLALQNTVKDMVKNVEKEIISAVSTNLKTEFDNEIERIMKNYEQSKEKLSTEKLNENLTQHFESTQERVKEFVKGIDSKLAASEKYDDEEDDVDSVKVVGDIEVDSVFEEEKIEMVKEDKEETEEEKIEMAKEDKEEEDATPKFSLNKPTFSPVEKPFSPEPAELKGRNAKKNAKKAAKKAAKKTVVLEDLKEDSAEDKQSSSSGSPDKDSIQAQTEKDEIIEDMIPDEQADVEEVSMIIDYED